MEERAMTERNACGATYGELADRLEKQIGADILPSMWVIPANDVRTIIAALRKSAESDTAGICTIPSTARLDPLP